MTADISTVKMEARIYWSNIFKVLSNNNAQPRILYQSKVSFSREDEIERNKELEETRLKKCTITRFSAKDILKDVRYVKRKKENLQLNV